MKKKMVNLSNQEIQDLKKSLIPSEVIVVGSHGNDAAVAEDQKEKSSKKRIFVMGSAAMNSDELLFRISLLEWLDYEVVLEEAGLNKATKNAYTDELMKTYLADLCSCDCVVVSIDGLPSIVVKTYSAVLDAINIVQWSYSNFTEQVAQKVYNNNIMDYWE